MTRFIQTHHADPVSITATDIPGDSGGNHRYVLSGINMRKNPSYKNEDFKLGIEDQLVIFFQNGHPAEHGVNGVTMESLVTVVIDRLLGFQSGPDVCEDNREAVEYFRKGLEALHRRADNRTEKIVLQPVAEHRISQH